MKMVNKMFLSFGGAMGLVAVFGYLARKERRKEMSEGIKVTVNNEKMEELKKVRHLTTVESEKGKLTEQEKRELKNRFGGMSRDELEFIVGLIPVDICLDRIEKELSRAKEFENHIKSALGSID